MTQTIVRLFTTREAADEAAQALGRAGFGTYDVTTVTPAEDASIDERAAEIERAHVPHALARAYAEHMPAGTSLVAAKAPFGMAQEAITTLDRCSPIPYIYEEERAGLPPWDAAAPLSSALLMPVLLHSPTPLSDAIGAPVLTRQRFSVSEWLKLPELTNDPAPFSNLFKLPLLSHIAAPFSALFKAPVLSDKAAPLSDAAKVPVLTDSPTPFSDKIKQPVLLHDPTPFSTFFKLPVLLRKRD